MILRKAQADGKTFWNLPSYLGTHYISQFSLIEDWLTASGMIRKSQLDRNQLRKLLIKTQLSDGSWYAVRDASILSGDLNATIINYWALKALDLPLASPALSKARLYIVSQGGLQNANLFTKTFLALFHNCSWEEIPEIPYILFSNWFPLNDHDFAQWIGPHLLPIAYLRKMQVSKDLGMKYRLDELWTSGESSTNLPIIQPRPRSRETRLVEDMLELQQPKGSWGAYTVSTLLALMTLDHYSSFFPDKNSQIDLVTERALNFVDEMYFSSGESAYLGVLDDGRYWDTALMGIAALEAGTPASELRSTAEYLISRQSPNGGFAFGEDFEFAPDTDDTAEILLLLSHFPDFQKPVERALHWLRSMQNKNGGWGAFSKDNNGNFILAAYTRAFEDSADLFDESSADVTGHILEALGTYGWNPENSTTVRKAQKYLLKTQEPKTGTWEGRWGINRIYGTSAAVIGLRKTGELPSSKAIRKAVAWIMTIQNRDGGFGESSLSYRDPAYFGRGPSTPSQTAWAMLALMEADPHAVDASSNEALERASSYLIDQLAINGKWKDLSTVGTGHPGLIYMNYPAYPYSFPLIALSRFLNRQ